MNMYRSSQGLCLICKSLINQQKSSKSSEFTSIHNKRDLVYVKMGGLGSQILIYFFHQFFCLRPLLTQTQDRGGERSGTRSINWRDSGPRSRHFISIVTNWSIPITFIIFTATDITRVLSGSFYHPSLTIYNST